MRAFAAVMTGRGTGAIATIQLYGDSAQAALAAIFRPADGRPLEPATGAIMLGHIVDGDQIIDQVTVGCEAPRTFAVHCHGNPLILAKVMALLQQGGVDLMAAEAVFSMMLTERQPVNAIAAEAKLALTTVKTIAGARMVSRQIEAGLMEKAGHWQRDVESGNLEQVVAEAGRILSRSRPVL